MNIRQISVKVINDNEAKIFLNLPHFKYQKLLGFLYRDIKTFRTIKRSYENLFLLYGFSGLGINEEILHRLNFEFIEIPYNDRILKTTRKHFLENAIPSNFVSERIDKQVILNIEKFVIPEVMPLTEIQSELFCEVANG